MAGRDQDLVGDRIRREEAGRRDRLAAGLQARQVTARPCWTSGRSRRRDRGRRWYQALAALVAAEAALAEAMAEVAVDLAAVREAMVGAREAEAAEALTALEADWRRSRRRDWRQCWRLRWRRRRRWRWIGRRSRRFRRQWRGSRRGIRRKLNDTCACLSARGLRHHRRRVLDCRLRAGAAALEQVDQGGRHRHWLHRIIYTLLNIAGMPVPA